MGHGKDIVERQGDDSIAVCLTTLRMADPLTKLPFDLHMIIIDSVP